MKGCEWDGPLVAKEVLEATDPALDAWQCCGPAYAAPGPAWASAEYCSEVLGQPRPSAPFFRSVWLSMQQNIPAITNVQSGCGGHSYLVFWRLSCSQVASVWPI